MLQRPNEPKRRPPKQMPTSLSTPTTSRHPRVEFSVEIHSLGN